MKKIISIIVLFMGTVTVSSQPLYYHSQFSLNVIFKEYKDEVVETF